jgi:hypothetical protein
VAVGIVRGDPPEVYLAEDEHVLSRVLALRVVAISDPADYDTDTLDRIRGALLEERWADAVAAWIAAGGEAVDGYPDEPVWTDAQLDADRASMEIRMAPIFHDG